MSATQDQAAVYAKSLFNQRHTLAWLFDEQHDLGSGSFSWDVEPSIGDDGEWGMPGTAVEQELIGRRALPRLLSPLLVGDALAVIEDSIRGRKDSYDIATAKGVRLMFRGSGAEVETFLIVEPDRGLEGIEYVSGMIGGAWRFFGIVTRSPDIPLPVSGGDVTEEQLRALVVGTTHVIFRGPSYDAYVLWTAGGN